MWWSILSNLRVQQYMKFIRPYLGPISPSTESAQLDLNKFFILAMDLAIPKQAWLGSHVPDVIRKFEPQLRCIEQIPGAAKITSVKHTTCYELQLCLFSLLPQPTLNPTPWWSPTCCSTQTLHPPYHSGEISKNGRNGVHMFSMQVWDLPVVSTCWN